VQIAYSVLSSIPVLLWLTIIGLSFMIVLTAKNIHFGFKEVGVLYVIFGIVFLVIFGAISSSVEPQSIVLENSDNLTPAQQEAVLNIVEPLGEEIISSIAGRVVVSGAVMTAIGVVSFAFGMYMTKHHVDHLALHTKRLQKASDPNKPVPTDEVYPRASKGRSKLHSDSEKETAEKSSAGQDKVKTIKKRPPKKIQ
jgi:hypothetical protein